MFWNRKEAPAAATSKAFPQRSTKVVNGFKEPLRPASTFGHNSKVGGHGVEADQANSHVGAVITESKNVISSAADMPAVRGVLTSTNSPNPGLKIPMELQDSLIAVKLGVSTARIYYDPLEVSKVMPYIGMIRSALSEVGISCDAKEYSATPALIRQVRLAGEAGQGKASGSLGQGSDGVKQFRDWVVAAHAENATDIHMRLLDGGKGEVMVRVDGSLEPIPGSGDGIFTDLEVLNAMKAAYEILSDRHSNNHGAFSETTTLSSMIDSALGIQNLRLRFSSIRGLYGPKTVCRLLQSAPGGKAMSFAEMGFAPSHIEIFERAQRLQAGAIGQMGVTGSGKTTVAKAFVETHPGYGEMAMYQVADPIEYPMEKLHQIYVQRSLLTLSEVGKKDPFSEAIESLMRSDPDLVDVGEVRDVLSARAMTNVAKSGHMSMFTLHVDKIEGAINRLTDPNIGLSRAELTTSSLLGMLCYQALSPVLCPHCKMDHNSILADLQQRGTDRSMREHRYITWLGDVLVNRFGLHLEPLRYRNPAGCEHCRSRGSRGLTICAEMLMPEAKWLDLGAAGKDREAMSWWRHEYSDRDLYSPNMNGKLVSEHAMFKALQGTIDPREIERFTQLASMEIIK